MECCSISILKVIPGGEENVIYFFGGDYSGKCGSLVFYLKIGYNFVNNSSQSCTNCKYVNSGAETSLLLSDVLYCKLSDVLSKKYGNFQMFI